MGRMETFQPAPPAAISRVLATFDRQQLEGFIAVAIDLLDLADGDPDREEDDAEDSFAFTPLALQMTRRVPGDITADEDDTAYVEWHTMRGAQKKGPNLLAGHEDDEEDDAPEEDDDPGQCTEDEISSGGVAYGVGVLRGPGCTISDPDYEGAEGR